MSSHACDIVLTCMSSPACDMVLTCMSHALTAQALFSYKGYHSMPTYLNVLNNAILRANLPPNADPMQYGEYNTAVRI